VTFPLYLDEDSVNRALIRALEDRGVDVANAVDSGLVGITDSEQLAYATGQQRVLFSYNIGDFAALHAKLLSRGGGHGGILLAPQQRYSVGEQMRRLLRIQAALQADAMKNRLEYLSGWG
jgi:hypothetical protein